MSNIDKVRYIEKRRQYKGYNKGWLYHRCKDEGLLKEYNQLYKPDADKLLEKNFKKDTRTKFSFGKYRGKPVEEVWERDRDYVKWLSRQEWLNDYPIEESLISDLFFQSNESQV